MPVKRSIVRFTEDERKERLGLNTKGLTSARLLSRERLLWKAGEGWKDKEIAQALNSYPSLVGLLHDAQFVHNRFRFEIIEQALEEILVGCQMRIALRKINHIELGKAHSGCRNRLAYAGLKIQPAERRF